MQPAPNPAADGPVRSDRVLAPVIEGWFVAVPLTRGPVALAATGLGYLGSAMLTGRCPTARACAVAQPA